MSHAARPWWVAIAILAGAAVAHIPLPLGKHPTRDLPTDAELVANLRSHPNEVALINAAERGPAIASSAGPLVTALLDSPDLEIRAAAARTLGFLSYSAAGPQLVRALGDGTDVHTTAYAAASLGRLGDRHALPALHDVARTYWYPPVRRAAAVAINQIETPGPLAPFSRLAWIFEQGLAYTAACGGNQIDRSLLPPALAVEGGRLTGVDHGEFGGGLYFEDGEGHQQKLGDMNVQSIGRVGGHVVAITGLAHMGMARGSVFRIERSADGAWHAFRWRRLPYAPYGAVEEDGQLRIVLPGADVHLDASGQFSMATCPTTHSKDWHANAR